MLQCNPSGEANKEPEVGALLASERGGRSPIGISAAGRPQLVCGGSLEQDGGAPKGQQFGVEAASPKGAQTRLEGFRAGRK